MNFVWRSSLGVFFGLSFWLAAESHAQVPAPKAERVNLAQAQAKFVGNQESEIQVVQNRKYSKNHKFEIGVNFGSVSADPFLAITSVGGYLGYHFSEYWGIRGFYWKDSAKKPSGVTKTETDNGIYLNTNAPVSMMGGEFKFTPMYGKVGLLGNTILYYDLSLFAGGGIRKTETGSSFSPVIGIGQQFFFAKSFAFGIDYRLLHYSEGILDRVPGSLTYGQVYGTRNDFSHNILLSLSCFI
jgi:outer membrane beta-barrel protein